ncbi:uncharacterized protein LOC126734662, partial [Anthonomus grandis grandis]|uniref:uncharacterized protein LOC126734662 n=1 Tax=Anthonomus grandis grandis TaxID=2921223 RepID=UPI0021650E04
FYIWFEKAYVVFVWSGWYREKYVLYFTNYHPICETELLSTLYEVPKNCDTRILNSHPEIWHKLLTPNSWIYITSQPIDTTISCESGKAVNLILNNTGIIKLLENCKIYTSSIMLISESIISESSFNHYIPTLELNDDCWEKPKNKTKDNIYLNPIVKTLDSESLNLVSSKLKQLDEMSEELETISFLSRVTNNTYLAFIFLSLIKIVLVYLGYKLYKKLRSYCPSNQKHSHGIDSKCSQLTNCLTLNFCKRSISKNIDLEFNEREPCSSETCIREEETPLTRSLPMTQHMSHGGTPPMASASTVESCAWL